MNEKKVHITFDYELFFGSETGTAKKCLLEPTERLIRLATEKKAVFVFFVDAGYLYKLQEYRNEEKCAKDLELISEQLKLLVSMNHEIGLHVHPHWEDCSFVNGKWKIDTSRYKLSDHGSNAEQIIQKFNRSLFDISGVKTKSFRAGGWCIQPFRVFSPALMKEGIFTDSSVFKNGFHEFEAHQYDFRNAPDKTAWTFSDDVCKEDPNGEFKEIAITSDLISPSFYYSLYYKMKMNPQQYRPIGDGMWLKDKKKIYSQFYRSTSHFACCDGFFASRLNGIFNRIKREKQDRMTVLGHPKSMAPCSFDYLSSFIDHVLSNGFQIKTLH